jgi:hypothetical protein
MNISDCNIHNLQFLPMAAKNETHVLILTLVITIGTIGAGLWWFTHNSRINLSQLSASKPDSNNFHQQSGAIKEQSNASSSQDISTRGVDYTDVKHDLQAHNWKQANIDTTEDLLKAFGSNSQRTGHVDPQEAANPPCQDIKILDQLWSKASNGNLGFTAQRQILQQAKNNYHQAYNQMQWQRPGGEWLIQYIYDGHRENFKPGYEPDYGNPDKGHLPTFERGYNFKYSFDGTLAKCGL